MVLVGIVGSLLVATQSGLDAPVTETPTVRTEILKGYQAAPMCEKLLDPEPLDDCFNRVLVAYKLNHTDTAAFGIGLHVREWRKADIFVQVTEKDPDNPLAVQWKAIAGWPRINGAMEALSAAGSLHITMDQVFDALELPEEVRVRWAFVDN